MKKILFFTLAAMLVAGCEKPNLGDVEEESDVSELGGGKSEVKNFTFTVKGDYGSATFTRGYLSADGQDMTDLWVFDYIDGVCAQSVHQSAGDADWGVPKMSLRYGNHHVYFVASRGDEPSVDESGHVISWGTTRDTFWKDYDVEVVSTSNGNRAVTLDRVATKLRVTINDEIPVECASVTVTPDRWYYGLDYVTGEAVSAQKRERPIAVPASYVGTAGQLTLSIFGLSEAHEWTTNVAVTAKDGDGGVLGTATIVGAPFKRNRATEYSGNLFSSEGGLDVSVNGNWENPKTGVW